METSQVTPIPTTMPGPEGKGGGRREGGVIHMNERPGVWSLNETSGLKITIWKVFCIQIRVDTTSLEETAK